MVSDLQAEDNRQFRLFSRFNHEWMAVAISLASLIIAGFATLIAVLASTDAKEANIRSQMQTEAILQLTDNVDHYKLRAGRLDSWLRAHGVPTEEIYDD